MKYFFAISLLCVAFVAQAQLQRPAIDGRFDEWISQTPTYVDEKGDGGSSGIDFVNLTIRNDERFLYLSFDVGREVVLQKDNRITLYIDADGSASTGFVNGKMGADIVWTFGDRQGTAYISSGPVPLKPADISLVAAPSFSSDRFEIAVDRQSEIDDTRMFTGSFIRVVLEDRSAGGDRLPDEYVPVRYSWRDDAYDSIATIPLLKTRPAHIRVLSWNVHNGGFMDADRRPAFTRILRVLQPDILCLQELFGKTAEEVQQYIRSILSPSAGKEFTAYKIDQGNVLVTCYPVEQKAIVLDNHRLSAFLLRVHESPVQRVLVVNAHLRCCNADDKRQQEADAFISFLRATKNGTGPFVLPERTPILLMGDMNFVGDRRQLQTLLTGDIFDNAEFGPDEPPDWDGGDLEDLNPRHVTNLFTFTWHNEPSNYLPGRLDYVLYSGSVLDIPHAYVFSSADLAPDELKRTGLWVDDSRTASDHFPVVADISLARPAGTRPAEVSHFRLQPVYPNPFSSGFTVVFQLDKPAPVSVILTDVLGRIFRARDLGMLSPGNHSVRINDADLPRVLKVLVRAGEKSAARTAVRIR
ncbi:MAG: hypothetical protein GXO82_06875 [Chlorobi bacterium]|nr:hypothetical protein [Chlorobiota bacterium]